MTGCEPEVMGVLHQASTLGGVPEKNWLSRLLYMDDPVLRCSAVVHVASFGPWVHTHGYEAVTALQSERASVTQNDLTEGDQS